MRLCICTILAVALSVPLRADEKSEARAIVDKAIEAHGGEAELKKLQTASSKMKGTVHIMGQDFDFTADSWIQGRDRQRVDVESDVGGAKFKFVRVLNRDKGWIKLEDNLSEMDKDKLADTQDAAHSAWVGTLIPLKDKAYELTLVGDDKVMDKPAIVVRVSCKDRRDIKLFFDKQTHLLVKTERRAIEDGSGKELTEDCFMSEFNEKGPKYGKKIAVKHDGKPFMEAEISELKLDEKFDDGVFGKP